MKISVRQTQIPYIWHNPWCATTAWAAKCWSASENRIVLWSSSLIHVTLVGLPWSSVLHFDLCINYEPTPVLAELVQAVLISPGPCYPHLSSLRPIIIRFFGKCPNSQNISGVHVSCEVLINNWCLVIYTLLDQQTDAWRCSRLRPCQSINHKIWRNRVFFVYTLYGMEGTGICKGAVDVLPWTTRGHHCCFISSHRRSSVYGRSTTRKVPTWAPTMMTCTISASTNSIRDQDEHYHGMLQK